MLRQYDCVCKLHYEADPYHAPYERIYAESRNKAKYKYIKIFPDAEYKNVLCRITIEGQKRFGGIRL